MSTMLAPSPLGTAPSFGFGDRLGLATPGHLAALREAGGAIRGIFAQQSIREMSRTRRTPRDVMESAVDALNAGDFDDPWSADADHLKTLDDVRRTMEAGFVFFTLDPSDDVDQLADSYDDSTLGERFQIVRGDVEWIEQYQGAEVEIAGCRIQFDAATIARAAVKYGKAIQRTISLARDVQQEAARLGLPFELELSVDETAHPTTPAEHYIIADQLRQADVRIVSLAPRFVGEFEKGVDFKGDLHQLEATMGVHAEIARRLGPYKLSLHSGSDKLSIYPILARTTNGLFHVKTAGTSYLEALRVAAQHDEPLFREIVQYSRSRYDEDRATYHVSATLGDAPESDQVDNVGELERTYIERWEDVPQGKGFTAPGRQILHCTFGSVVTNENLGPRLIRLLESNLDAYTEALREHFVRHLEALNSA
jgi:hypothetical protein